MLARFGGDLPVGVPRMVVPGAIDAWLTCQASLRLADVLAPAIELAEGFAVSQRLAAHIVGDQATIERWPTTAAVFLPHGRSPGFGDVLVQSDLAAFLGRLIRLEDRHRPLGRAGAIMAVRDDFSIGDIAGELVAFLAEHDSGPTAMDLAAARVTVESPCRGRYRGTELLTCGPWSQGPVLAMALQILEGVDLSAAGPRSVDALHAVAEALKLSLADRDAFFGDPEHVDVPIVGLLDQGYAAMRRTRLDVARASPSLPAPADPWPAALRKTYRWTRARPAAHRRSRWTRHDLRRGHGCCGERLRRNTIRSRHARTGGPGARRNRLHSRLAAVARTRSPVGARPGQAAAADLQPRPAGRGRDRGDGVRMPGSGRSDPGDGAGGQQPRRSRSRPAGCDRVPTGHLHVGAELDLPARLATRRAGGRVACRSGSPGRAPTPGPPHRAASRVRPQAAGVSAARRRPNGVLEAGADPRREGSAIGR